MLPRSLGPERRRTQNLTLALMRRALGFYMDGCIETLVCVMSLGLIRLLCGLGKCSNRLAYQELLRFREVKCPPLPAKNAPGGANPVHGA